MVEEFKPVYGFEGLYEVSNTGKVFSLNYDGTGKRKELKYSRNQDGYCQCVLYRNGDKFSKKVHRLVAESFIPNPNNMPQVNHIDEDKGNNCIDNLEWCSIAYNANYGLRNQKISKRISEILKKPVVSIDKNGNVTKYDSMKDAEQLTGISQANISSCCRHKRNTAGGFQWQYV